MNAEIILKNLIIESRKMFCSIEAMAELFSAIYWKIKSMHNDLITNM